MEENFNMRKIHAGYVVEFRNGERALAMRCADGPRSSHFIFISAASDFIFGRETDWEANTLARVAPVPEHIGTRDWDIMRVYGYVHVGYHVKLVLSTATPGYHCRDLLWERKEAVKMTLAQICEELGYDIEIIKEDEQ